MKYNNIIKSFIYLISYILTINCELLSVHMFMRHGIETPANISAALPNRYTSAQLNQLTNRGCKQSIQMGKYLKKRYANFYPKSPRQAIIRSTNADRCLDTISLIANQLWPPTKENYGLTPHIFHPPIPLDLFDQSFCPNADRELKMNTNSPQYNIFGEQNKDLTQLINEKTGLRPTIHGIHKVFDYLKAQKVNGGKLPEWVTDELYERMGQIYFEDRKHYFASEKMIKFRAGPLIAELVKRMKSVIKSHKNDVDYEKIFMYTTRNAEIYGLLNALQIDMSTYAPYLATVITELHQINDSLFVKIFYINETESTPISGTQVKPSFCAHYNCPFDIFIKSIINLIPNWRTDCDIPQDFDFFNVMEKYLTVTDENFSMKKVYKSAKDISVYRDISYKDYQI